MSETETVFVVLRWSADEVVDMLERMSGIADKVSVYEIS
jgi:hypothetical protein